jgi:hypothetical protein
MSHPVERCGVVMGEAEYFYLFAVSHLKILHLLKPLSANKKATDEQWLNLGKAILELITNAN